MNDGFCKSYCIGFCVGGIAVLAVVVCIMAGAMNRQATKLAEDWKRCEARMKARADDAAKQKPTPACACGPLPAPCQCSKEPPIQTNPDTPQPPAPPKSPAIPQKPAAIQTHPDTRGPFGCPQYHRPNAPPRYLR